MGFDPAFANARAVHMVVLDIDASDVAHCQTAEAVWQACDELWAKNLLATQRRDVTLTKEAIDCYRRQARCIDDVVIDPDACVASADRHGAFVAAWIFVAAGEEEVEVRQLKGPDQDFSGRLDDAIVRVHKRFGGAFKKLAKDD